MDAIDTEAAAAACISRELLRYLVTKGLPDQAEVHRILTKASAECREDGPTIMRQQKASALIDRIRDADFAQ